MTTELSPSSRAKTGLAVLKTYRSQPLEALLDNLCCVGQPRLGVYGKGWHCAVEMHVAAAGTTFTVKSDFGMSTATMAALQCAERVVATLEQWA